MKKEYESTIEEAVEAHFRVAEHLGTIRKLKWIGLIVAPGIFIALFFLIDYLAAKLVVGGSAALLFILYYLTTYEKDYRKRIRKMLVKALGTDQPIRTECEIDEHGLAFRKMGQEIRFSWANVKVLNETTKYLEIMMEPTGIAIIPKRIFAEPEEIHKWIEYIEDHKGSNKLLEHTSQ